ncbi:MAG: copper transporter [Solirubrobacteraceae bacterium]
MFDFRYHALSLAAVLIALTLGILLGVAIGDAGLVSSAEQNLRDQLRSNLKTSQDQTRQLQAQLALRSAFESDVYPLLVGGKLNGKRIGLLFIGQPTDATNRLVRSALDGTGGQLVVVGVVRDPPDLPALGSLAAPGRYGTLASDATLLRPFAVRMGKQLALGGRLVGRVQGTLLSSYNGSLQPLDGVVLVRSRPTLSAAEAKIADTFEQGLASGLSSSGVPVVGAETSATNPSNVSWFRSQNLSSVDNLDDLAGRTALVFALVGAHGAFGTKSTAETLLPQQASAPAGAAPAAQSAAPRP